MAALQLAEGNFRNGRHWPDWSRVRIDTLEALGQSAQAQTARWAIFENSLNADYLRAYLKRLPDFDDTEAEERALTHVRQHVDFHQELGGRRIVWQPRWFWRATRHSMATITGC